MLPSQWLVRLLDVGYRVALLAACVRADTFGVRAQGLAAELHTGQMRQGITASRKVVRASRCCVPAR
jgi:hypothetical protein